MNKSILSVVCVFLYMFVYTSRKRDERAAQNVTESLMELRQVLSSQVQQSEETMHVLGKLDFPLA